jgi:hypothetical protein
MTRTAACAAVLNVTGILCAVPPLCITEVAPAESGSRDWVELYVVQDGDYGGWWLLDGGFDEVIRVLPSREYRAGEHILVCMGMSDPDDIAAVRGCWRFSSAWAGLTGTDGVLLLADGSGVWRDAVGYANRDGTVSATTLRRWRLLQESGMWRVAAATDAATIENNLADWSGGGAGMSLCRRRGALGVPVDTDDAADWYRARQQTPGRGYGGESGSEPRIFAEVPGGVYRPLSGELAIRWSVDGPDWVKTIRVVGVRQRREVARLMDADVTSCAELPWYGVTEGTVLWDGRGVHGGRVPPGWYAVVLEISDPRTRRRNSVRTAVAVVP